ncbi:MAG: hypothetical protein LH702_14370 [Phormidesmis sp. CAN_BIN44]|nr:hypothetical protein [Phormidesmis sp. CAN_BIN44]
MVVRNLGNLGGEMPSIRGFSPPRFQPFRMSIVIQLCLQDSKPFLVVLEKYSDRSIELMQFVATRDF